MKQLPSPGGFFPLLLGVGDRSRPFQLVDVTQEEPPPTAVERLKTALAEAEIPPEAGHFLPLSAARDRQWERSTSNATALEALRVRVAVGMRRLQLIER